MRVQLTEEQRMLVGTIRDLARSTFRARVMKYMDGTFPWENMRDLAKLGILGMAVPEEYGGSGLPVFDTALVSRRFPKSVM
jgi:alkylation response protein AidB-like acyl-CoA dehydrogenase